MNAPTEEEIDKDTQMFFASSHNIQKKVVYRLALLTEVLTTSLEEMVQLFRHVACPLTDEEIDVLERAEEAINLSKGGKG